MGYWPSRDAARMLGTTPAALRKRKGRGSIQWVRDGDGTVRYWVDPEHETAAEPSHSGTDGTPRDETRLVQLVDLNEKWLQHVEGVVAALETRHREMIAEKDARIAEWQERATKAEAALTEARTRPWWHFWR